MTNPDDEKYMSALIQKAQEFVGHPIEPPVEEKKTKAKRNLSDDRREELRQRMIKLREKSLVSRQATAKAKKQPKEVETKKEEEVKKEEVEVKKEVKPITPEVQTIEPVVKVLPIIEVQPAAKIYPTYYLPTMKFGKKHGLF